MPDPLPATRGPVSSPRSFPGKAAWVLLAGLLILPGLALYRYAAWVDLRLLIGLPTGITVFTFLAYRSDKRRAETGRWRIPESTLHLAELLGGWPGGFLGQRVFRHKTSKISYQVVFWFIVFLHQIAALDCLNDWQFSRDLMNLLRARFS